jgi:hypothetical protein
VPLPELTTVLAALVEAVVVMVPKAAAAVMAWVVAEETTQVVAGAEVTLQEAVAALAPVVCYGLYGPELPDNGLQLTFLNF